MIDTVETPYVCSETNAALDIFDGEGFLETLEIVTIPFAASVFMVPFFPDESLGRTEMRRTTSKSGIRKELACLKAELGADLKKEGLTRAIVISLSRAELVQLAIETRTKVEEIRPREHTVRIAVLNERAEMTFIETSARIFAHDVDDSELLPIIRLRATKDTAEALRGSLRQAAMLN